MNYNPYGYGYPGAGAFRSAEQNTEDILEGIKKKDAAVQIFSQLVDAAPDEFYKNEIRQARENEQRHLNHFKKVYTSLTGEQPEYEREEASFQTFEEGLRAGYDRGIEEFENYQKAYVENQGNQLGDVFYRACHDKVVTTNRIVALSRGEGRMVIKDYGGKPFALDIEEATTQNRTFRTALWTGDHLQVTLMSIAVGDDIGLEVHPDVDQFLRIEEGQGIVQMGDSKNQLNFQQQVSDDYAIMVPAGKWHNLTNTGQQPLKLYSIYAPPEHPFGTVHKTKADAMADEE